MKTALVLIDLQKDYFPGGAMELAGSDEAGKQAGRLLNACRESGIDVIHVQHVSLRPGATFFLPDTAGVQIHDLVAPRNNEVVITKHYPNSFRETPLQEQLERLAAKELIFAGMMTHMCVDSTVRAAFDLGFTCTLAQDACATRPLEWNGTTVPAAMVQAAFLAALGGIFTRLATVEGICRQLPAT